MAIDISQLANEIEKELNGYSKDVTEGVKQVVDEVMDDLVKETKKRKKRTGKYRRAISSKLLYEDGLRKIKVWYVKKPYYTLTHLLNDGHANRGGGRTEGDNHIGIAEQNAIESLENKIKEVIEKGGN